METQSNLGETEATVFPSSVLLIQCVFVIKLNFYPELATEASSDSVNGSPRNNIDTFYFSGVGIALVRTCANCDQVDCILGSFEIIVVITLTTSLHGKPALC